MGGMIPGLILSLLLGIYVAVISFKRKYPRGEQMAFRMFLRVTLEAFPALFYRYIVAWRYLPWRCDSNRSWCPFFCICNTHLNTHLSQPRS